MQVAGNRKEAQVRDQFADVSFPDLTAVLLRHSAEQVAVQKLAPLRPLHLGIHISYPRCFVRRTPDD